MRTLLALFLFVGAAVPWGFAEDYPRELREMGGGLQMDELTGEFFIQGLPVQPRVIGDPHTERLEHRVERLEAELRRLRAQENSR